MYRRDLRDVTRDVFLSELAVADTVGTNPQALPSSDGKYIAYPRGREDRMDLWITGESMSESRLTSGELVTSPYPRYHVDARWMDWHPSDPKLAYAASTAGTADLWIADVETGEKSRVTRHSAADGDPAFAPDGSELAFVTDHWSRCSLAVGSVDGDDLTCLRDDEYSYADPRWIDDDTLYAVRTPHHDAFDYETDIIELTRDGDVTIVRSIEGAKSYAPRCRPGSDEIVFVDDSSGYDSLYRLFDDGSVEPLFEPNGAQVGAPTWRDDGQALAVNLTTDCETQVWVVSLDDDIAPTCVSKRRGCHGMPAWRGENVLSVVSTPTTPLAVRNVTADRTLSRSQPRGFDERLVEPDRLVYESEGGIDIQALVYLPSDISSDADEIPVLVNPHQGPTLFDGFEFDFRPQYFAALGYAVVQPNYRGSAGFGRVFRNRNDGAWGTDDLADVVNAVDAVADEYTVVDGGRAGIFGSSLGGIMTVNALGKTDRFDAGAAFSGIYDYERFLDDTADAGTRLLTRELGLPRNNRELYRKLSPIRTAPDIDVPVLVLHGEQDTSVHVSQSEILVDVLESHDKRYEYRPYADEGHSFARRENIVDAYTRVADLFAKYV